MGTKIAAWVLEGTLKEVAKQIGIGALNKITAGLFDTNIKNAQQLTEILSKLDAMNSKLSDMQNSIDDGFFGIKVDNVDQAVERISGDYDMYMSAVKGFSGP